MNVDDRMQIGVFFGGPSAEHDVSCASAKAVVRVLPSDRYGLVVVGVTRSGGFVLLSEAAVENARSDRLSAAALDDRLEAVGRPVELLPDRSRRALRVVAADRPDVQLARIDVAFPVLHGPYGEDGVFQGLLEAYHVRYVGCGVGASAIAMDKVAMKRVFTAEGIPITPYRVITAKSWTQTRNFLSLVEGLHWPLFVKPARLGSSIGVSCAKGPTSLSDAVELALCYGNEVIVEQGVVNAREIDCGVLTDEDGTVRTSLPAQIKVVDDLLDFRQKYVDQEETLTVPAQVPARIHEQISTLALAAFRAVGGYGLARVDFLWDEAADRLYVCEINTMPGFTARSTFARAWDASGVTYPKLVKQLIDQALVRPSTRGGAEWSH
jgi:D-alanine-D-alanine ligase